MRSLGPCREIDRSVWPRARHYELFAAREYPFLGVSAQLDISAWDAWRRRSGRKFFPAFLHHVMLALNSIENFRYRIHDGRVFLCEKTDPAFVVSCPEDELYYFAVAGLDSDPAVFDRNVERAKAEALAARRLGGDRQDVAFVSCLPWFTFTDIIQPMRLNAADSIPRIVWGKYVQGDGAASVSFSVTGHHGLFDGLHVAGLFERIQAGPDI